MIHLPFYSIFHGQPLDEVRIESSSPAIRGARRPGPAVAGPYCPVDAVAGCAIGAGSGVVCDFEIRMSPKPMRR